MQVSAITQEQFADLAETASVIESIDLGVVSILRIKKEDQEELLLSTTNEQYAHIRQ